MLKTILAWFHPAPVSGIVTGKHSYGAAGMQNQIPSATGKTRGIDAEGIAGAWSVIDDSPAYYLSVRDAGDKVKKIFVDENTFNNIEIGDRWPST
jgi:hypothetical protein